MIKPPTALVNQLSQKKESAKPNIWRMKYRTSVEVSAAQVRLGKQESKRATPKGQGAGKILCGALTLRTHMTT
jgi:hypothetical protein